MNKAERYLLPILLAALCTVTSCGVYNNQFQCPGGKGLNCVAAGEVVDLIVEREEEEDLFVKSAVDAKRSKEKQKAQKTSKKKKSQRLVMKKDEEGNLVLFPEAEENSYR